MATVSWLTHPCIPLRPWLKAFTVETDWPTYGASANALSLLEGNITVIPDTAREEQM